jgi:hypothetical protein
MNMICHVSPAHDFAGDVNCGTVRYNSNAFRRRMVCAVFSDLLLRRSCLFSGLR